ncbi:MAG: DoxX family protein [Acidobacteriota bacterium]|nr:DoxX family protein [Acidobacteriota bacterium]
MKAKVVGYWISTVAIALVMLSGGVMEVMRSPAATAGITHLGYPVHFSVLLGVWKIVGATVILLPGLALAKEWAYAGIFIDLTGASVAHAAVGDGAGNIIAPLVFAAILVASWALRPASRTEVRLGSMQDELAGLHNKGLERA